MVIRSFNRQYIQFSRTRILNSNHRSFPVRTLTSLYNHNQENSDQNGRRNYGYSSFSKIIGVGSGVLLGSALISWGKSHSSSEKHLAASISKPSGQIKSNLPTYKAAEISEHYDSNKRIWVSFNRGVYDVTDFVNKHPGGNKLLMAAGGSLEPFWEVYPVHQKTDVFEILEKYRIGNLAEEDVFNDTLHIDSFKGEPSRHPALLKRTTKPFNGETPPYLLTEKFLTNNDLFYVRNHLPVPDIDVKSFRLEIEGDKIPKKGPLSIDDIKKFPKIEITATIQCGGNRRSDMGKSKNVAGLPWSGGAIGNATWSGARLRDVLKFSGFKLENYKNPEKYHVQFEGLDTDPSGESYGASIPLSYILDENFDAILAYEMNGKTIPLDHGFPLRIILPGIVGARSVKWLNRIVISTEESQSPWQQRDYKVFSPSVTMDNVDFSKAPAIMDTPLNSYICSHEDGEIIHKGQNTFKGWAFSGGGRKIVRVELSIDKGKTWQDAILKEKDQKDGTRNWSWVLWELPTNLGQKGDYEVWVKCVDSGYNQQPEDFENMWNYRGLLAHAYHKIKVKVQ